MGAVSGPEMRRAETAEKIEWERFPHVDRIPADHADHRRLAGNGRCLYAGRRAFAGRTGERACRFFLHAWIQVFFLKRKVIHCPFSLVIVFMCDHLYFTNFLMSTVWYPPSSLWDACYT